MSSLLDITTFVSDAVRSPTRLRKQFGMSRARSPREVGQESLEGSCGIEGGMDHVSVHRAMRSGEIAQGRCCHRAGRASAPPGAIPTEDSDFG